MEIKFFNQSVEDFVGNLKKPTIAKVLRTIDLLEHFGNGLGMPHSKKIAEGLFELRIHGQKEIRILYCFYKDVIILLHGFIKKTQKLPKKHLNLARKRYNLLAKK